jgi:hypothetical protein
MNNLRKMSPLKYSYVDYRKRVRDPFWNEVDKEEHIRMRKKPATNEVDQCRNCEVETLLDMELPIEAIRPLPKNKEICKACWNRWLKEDEKFKLRKEDIDELIVDARLIENGNLN